MSYTDIVKKSLSSSRRSRSRSRSKTRLKSKSRSRSRSRSRSKSTKTLLNKVEKYIDIPHRKKYKEESIEKYKSKHIGQRKLYTITLYFLTLYGHLSNTIVYAGAAHGHNIGLLSLLFPNHIFHLYDPGLFKLKVNKNIKIYNQLFTQNDAAKYSGKDVLFMSDIRVYNDESTILQDNNLQREWVKIIRPIKSMLKFRLPFPDGKYCKDNILNGKCLYSYFKGELILQPWAPHHSTEMRLIVDKSNIDTDQLYDCIEIEEKLFYHNSETRNKLIKIGNSMYTWDEAQEIYTINLYIKNIININDYTLDYILKTLNENFPKNKK
jgi:hypothetical protein